MMSGLVGIQAYRPILQALIGLVGILAYRLEEKCTCQHCAYGRVHPLSLILCINHQ